MYAKGKGYCVCMCVSMHISIITIIALPTSKCHYIFLANVFLGVTQRCMCVCMCLHAFFSFFVSITVCMWDQMWAGLFAFPAVPEQVLRGPALSPRVDKRMIFKEREGENDSGLSKLDKFPANTLSLAAPPVQRAAERSQIEGKRVDFASGNIRRSIYFI